MALPMPTSGTTSTPLPILFVTDSLMAGGIESQLVALATGLDRAEYAPRVLSLYGPTVRDLHFAPELERAGIPLDLPDLPMSAAGKARGVAAITRAVWQTRPRLIQAEGYHANLLLRLAAPVLPPVPRLGAVRGVLTPKQMRYERLSHWLLSAIAVNGPHLKEALVREGGVPAAKIHDIPNGIAVDRYRRPRDPALRARLARGGNRLFVSLARISLEKNVHWTVEALGLLKRRGALGEGVRFAVAGAPHHARAQELLDTAIARDTLEDVVAHYPATDDPAAYYAAADVVVLCSPATEGTPNVVLEALAAGRPVIISAAANAARVVEEGVTGWEVPTGDVEALAETLRCVIALPDAALEAMRPACVARAADFAAARMVRRYADLYATLASRPAEPMVAFF